VVSIRKLAFAKASGAFAKGEVAGLSAELTD
jgi:hypothetical protein